MTTKPVTVPWCNECGENPRSDEDGCCATCGRDIVYRPRGARSVASVGVCPDCGYAPVIALPAPPDSSAGDGREVWVTTDADGTPVGCDLDESEARYEASGNPGALVVRYVPEVPAAKPVESLAWIPVPKLPLVEGQRYELPDSDTEVLVVNHEGDYCVAELEFTDDSEGNGEPYWAFEGGDVALCNYPWWRPLPAPPAADNSLPAPPEDDR